MKKVLFLIVSLFIVSCSEEPKERSSVMSLSVSSDGRFVLSTHHGRKLWLWDLKYKNHQEISNNVNIFSPYILHNTHKIMWQELKNNVVHIRDIDKSNERDSLLKPGFPVYGHLLTSDEKHYFASDIDWNIFHIFQSRSRVIKPADNGPSYLGVGKLLNLSLSETKNYLLSSGKGSGNVNESIEENFYYEFAHDDIDASKYSRWGGVMLWDVLSGKPLQQLGGNMSKTYATLSPDGRYVVAGDEGGGLNVWEAQSGKYVFRGASIVHGRLINNEWDNSKLIKIPKDFCDSYSHMDCYHRQDIFAIKFINNNQYLRFITYIPYAILYDVESPWPKKYLHLDGENPDVYGYMESARVDTAPDKGILVMASTTTSGILVYQYNKNDKTLKLIWSPDGPPPHKPIRNPKIKI